MFLSTLIATSSLYKEGILSYFLNHDIQDPSLFEDIQKFIKRTYPSDFDWLCQKFHTLKDRDISTLNGIEWDIICRSFRFGAFQPAGGWIRDKFLPVISKLSNLEIRKEWIGYLIYESRQRAIASNICKRNFDYYFIENMTLEEAEYLILNIDIPLTNLLLSLIKIKKYLSTTLLLKLFSKRLKTLKYKECETIYTGKALDLFDELKLFMIESKNDSERVKQDKKNLFYLYKKLVRNIDYIPQEYWTDEFIIDMMIWNPVNFYKLPKELQFHFENIRFINDQN